MLGKDETTVHVVGRKAARSHFSQMNIFSLHRM